MRNTEGVTMEQWNIESTALPAGKGRSRWRRHAGGAGTAVGRYQLCSPERLSAQCAGRTDSRLLEDCRQRDEAAHKQTATLANLHYS